MLRRLIKYSLLGFAGVLLLGVVIGLLNGPASQRTTTPPAPPSLSSDQLRQQAEHRQERERQQAAQAQQQAALEQQQQALAHKKLQEDVNRFAEVTKKSTLIQHLSAREHLLTITIADAWHYQPYQLRLQGAQDLWKIWAGIHFPDKPDTARVSIVDRHGNEVAGSRVWGGSLIWAQEK